MVMTQQATPPTGTHSGFDIPPLMDLSRLHKDYIINEPPLYWN